MNMHQKITKPQANIPGARGRFQANICGALGSLKSNISLDLQGFSAFAEKSHSRAEKRQA
jgi:hypothetical protein